METMNELIPFARELLSQRPNRGLLKVYLVGSVFAVLGTVIGLVETVCSPFTSSEEPLDTDLLFALSRRELTALDTGKRSARGDAQAQEVVARVVVAIAEEDEATEMTEVNALPQSHRSPVNRLHAS